MAISTLNEYYTSKGHALPSLTDRAKTYESLGLGAANTYQGTAAQNTLLLQKLASAPAPTVTPTPSPVPPMIVAIDDPDGGTSASSLTSYCNLANYSSVNRDSGYAGCAATTISLCNTGACAPEPGDNGLGPVMRVTVSGGVAPYTVRLKNFQP